MYQIIYVSSATYLFSQAELLALLEQSRANNEKSGITGILLYRDGNILQLLEGAVESVQGLYQKIEQDPRHKGTIVLWEGPVAERDFPDWRMAFRDLSLLANNTPPGFSQFINLPLTPVVLKANPSRAMKLINVFKRNMI